MMVLMDELPMLLLFLCLLKNTVDALRFQENFLSYDCVYSVYVYVLRRYCTFILDTMHCFIIHLQFS